jgi:flagellar biogenesis protein FliO
MKKSVLPNARDAGTQVAAPSSNSSTRMRPDRGSPPSIPRWVKVLAIIALVLFLLFVILLCWLLRTSVHKFGTHVKKSENGQRKLYA